jgi:GAF domain-containing protein
MRNEEPVPIEDPLREGFDALARFFIGDGTLGDTLTKVSELARDALSADMAGITMMVGGRPGTGVFTDPIAPRIDTEQYRTGRGPCLAAFHDQVSYRIDDTATDERWPEFAARAAAAGIVTTLSLPLAGPDESLGALNLYSRHSGRFGEAETRQAEMLAAQAAMVLANANAFHDVRQLNENLNQALTSRRMIDYAIGLLMSTGGRTPEDAFEVLVRASQRENRKLRDIATEIVTAVQKRPVTRPDKA